MATVNAPRLNGRRRPSALRVPFGEDGEGDAALQSARGDVDAHGRCFPVGTVHRNELRPAHPGGQDGDAEELLLDENRNAARNRGYERERVEIGHMIGGEEARTGRNVFKVFDANADADDAISTAHHLHR